MSNEEGDHNEDNGFDAEQSEELHDQLAEALVLNEELSKELAKEHKAVEQMKKEIAEIRAEALHFDRFVLVNEFGEDGAEGRLGRNDRTRAGSQGTASPQDCNDGGDGGGGGGGGHRTASSKGYKKKQGLRSRLYGRLDQRLQDFLYYFGEESAKSASSSAEERFSVRKLKDNVRRAKRGVEPFASLARAVHFVHTWESPSLSAFSFLLYLLALYYGWLLPGALLVLIVRLAFNYVSTWSGCPPDRRFAYTPPPAEEDEPTRSMQERLRAITEIGAFLQHALGRLASVLEKTRHLLAWTDPRKTRPVFLGVCGAFVVSVCVPGRWIYLALGTHLGFEFFIIKNLYARFPRLRRRFDTAGNFIARLYDDHDFERDLLEFGHRAPLARAAGLVRSAGGGADAPMATGARRTGGLRQRHGTSGPEGEGDRADSTGATTLEKDHFLQARCRVSTHTVEATEHQLGSWHSFLFNKESPLLGGFRSGTLHLTNRHLLFESYYVNYKIPLADITAVNPFKPFAFTPGNGMSVEVITTQGETYIFGKLMNRNGVRDRILHAMRVAPA